MKWQSPKEHLEALLSRAKAYDENLARREQEAREAERATWLTEYKAELNALSPENRALVAAQERREAPGLFIFDPEHVKKSTYKTAKPT